VQRANKGELDKARAEYERARLIGLSQRSVAQAEAGNSAAPAASPAGKAQPPATAERGGFDAAAAPEQGGVRQVLEKYGILGTWSVDCSNLASPRKAYSVYRLHDENQVQRDVITGTEQQAGIVESAVEVGPNELMITWLWETREVVRLHVDGNRLRHMEVTRNGTRNSLREAFIR
jgi:hypothetical protein